MRTLSELTDRRLEIENDADYFNQASERTAHLRAEHLQIMREIIAVKDPSSEDNIHARKVTNALETSKAEALEFGSNVNLYRRLQELKVSSFQHEKTGIPTIEKILDLENRPEEYEAQLKAEISKQDNYTPPTLAESQTAKVVALRESGNYEIADLLENQIQVPDEN